MQFNEAVNFYNKVFIPASMANTLILCMQYDFVKNVSVSYFY